MFCTKVPFYWKKNYSKMEKKGNYENKNKPTMDSKTNLGTNLYTNIVDKTIAWIARFSLLKNFPNSPHKNIWYFVLLKKE